MLIIGCKACSTAVWSHCSYPRVSAAMLLNTLEIPCPCCGSISMWDCVSNDAIEMEASRKMIAEEIGWRWSDHGGEGFYRLRPDMITRGQKAECNCRSLRKHVEPASAPGVGRWWFAKLVKAALEREQ